MKLKNKENKTKVFPSYMLTNSLSRIKSMKNRIKTLETVISSENQETEYNGLKVVKNFEAERLQLIFEGKPSDEIRGALKANGFRWSPKNNAWQRKLTENANWTFKHYILDNDKFSKYFKGSKSTAQKNKHSTELFALKETVKHKTWCKFGDDVKITPLNIPCGDRGISYMVSNKSKFSQLDIDKFIDTLSPKELNLIRSK